MATLPCGPLTRKPCLWACEIQPTHEKRHEKYGSQYAEEFIPNWKRFLDDCFILWTKSKSDLLELNNQALGYKNLFILNSAELKIYPAHKY